MDYVGNYLKNKKKTKDVSYRVLSNLYISGGGQTLAKFTS